MEIFIDADGCPVVNTAINLAKKYNTECTLIFDTSHEFKREDVKKIVVSKGADSADFKLVNLINKGDAVITQDYGLAAMCLAKGAYVLNQNGVEYNAENIDGMLFARYNSKKIRMSGGRVKGFAKRSSSDDENFAKAFENLLNNTKKI